MSYSLWADRPDGGRIAFSPESCIEFPLRDDGVHVESMYFDPSEKRWLWRAWFRGMTASLNGIGVPKLVDDGPCRVVPDAEARKLFKAARKAIPPELAVSTPKKPR